MKLLYLNSGTNDYLQDLLYSGLVKVLGTKSVYDEPLNPLFHFYKKKYPQNLGYSRSFSALFRGGIPELKNFDAVILASCKPQVVEAYLKILPRISSSTPVVFIDGGDEAEVGGDFVRTGARLSFSQLEKVRPFDLIFKREYLSQHQSDARIKPLPMCMNLDRLPKNKKFEKKYDVSFWAVESDPIRTQALTLLQDHFDCRNNGTTTQQTFRKYARKGLFYLEELARCKIVLNLRGAGWDTLRYWECPAMGAFMVTQKPAITIPNDFVNNVHVVHCKEDLSDLLDICRYYLQHADQRETMAQKAQLHLQQFHTDVHRAETVIQHIQSLL